MRYTAENTKKHNVLKRLDLRKIKGVVVQTLKPDYEGWFS